MALVPSAELSRARDNVKRIAAGFTPGQKVVTAVALLAVVVGGLMFMSLSGKPTYQPLFTNLSAQDAGAITQKLTSDKVPYQLTNGGSTIMVPANQVDQQRLAMASAGLPATSTVGLSILDKEGITTSNLTQQADYLRALQGELEQTIDSIGAVSSSLVRVALPANQNFALNNAGPTGASVMVTLKPGQTLSNSQVQAIVHLVASAIPGLNATNVTVADSTGNLLAGPGVAQGVAGANSATQAYDTAVQQKVLAYLQAVVGPNNADVQVNATLNYSKVSTTTNSLLPVKGTQPSFCTQTNKSTTTYTNGAVPPGGTAGAVTAPVGTGTGNYTQNQSTQSCETNTQTQTVQQAPGTVQVQSVSVLVNKSAVPAAVSLTALQNGVAAAAGINTARGDTLAFSAMPFNTAAAQKAAAAAKAAQAAASKQAMGSLIRTGVVLLAVALVLFLLWRASRKARQRSQPTVLSPAELALLQGPQLLPADTMAVPIEAPSHEALEVHRFIDRQPEDVAKMLRTWMAEKG